MAVPVTDVSVDNFIEDHHLVAVQCYLHGCKPCHQNDKLITVLSREFHGNIVFGKLDKNQNQNFTDKYKVRKVPAILIFHDGIPIERWNGVPSHETCYTRLSRIIDSCSPCGD